VLPIWPAGRENRALLAAEPAADLGPGWTWSSAVRAHAATRPEASAVVGRSGALNYAELNDLADRVAASLQARGVRRGDVVAMLLPNDTDVAVAILAAHRAGASYLPLHVDHPVERLRYQIEDAGVKVAIASSDLSSRLPYGIEVVSVASLVETAGDLVDPGEHDDAYLIYTSGSTGAPKGVVITHGNLAAYAAGVVARLSLTGVPTSCAAVTSLATDLALTAVSVAWATGGALHLVDPATAGDGAALAQRFAAQRPDLLKVTPSHLRGLLAAGGPGVLPTRTLVFGGEALPWDLVEQVRSLRDCDIVNHYGPSETTVGAFAQVLPRDAARTTATVPIGTPLPSYRAYVLDTEGVEVPEGAPGELVIGGTAVSLAGYLGQPQLTEQRFGVADGVRTYRTGDRVRVTSHGVEFLGRIDDQLKIRGFRVEPGEVEAALADQVGVDACAVVGRADQPGGLRLVGYVVGAVRSAADVQSLRSALLERLPEHAVPSLIVPIAALPLLPNGKVDRGALPDPETLRLVDEAAYVAPRTPIEEALATIWSELLHVERVGVEDDFFALGGHSLLATQIIARILAQFGVQLPLHSLFVAPNVAALAQLVAEHQQGAPEDDDLVEVLRTIEQLSDEQAAGLLESGSA
jgi:amino acid adenylation domain-containing protein